MTSKKAVYILFFAAVLSAAHFSCTENKRLQREDNLASFLSKKDVTIVVTDSGLGGLSILADAVERMEQWRAFRSVRFVFFNALFSNEGGYNSLQSREEKIKIFDSSLKSMTALYEPDLIIIGCNTLSVLYDETPFSRITRTPVMGIVTSGVDLISSQMRSSPEAVALIFATQTTLEEGEYRQKLIQKGFLSERIKEQACPDLVPYIERGFDSPETEMLIFAYVDEALQKIRADRSSLIISLNCTHYGYSLELWKKAFASLGVKPLVFLNPNTTMNDFLFPPKIRGRFTDIDMTVEVVSMIEISNEKTASIGGWLERISPRTSYALKKYTLNKNLFPWKKFIQPGR